MAKQKKIKNTEIDPDFRLLFLDSELGRIVLGKILDGVNFFEDPADDVEIAVQSFCKKILTACGVSHGLKGYDYLTALSGIALPVEQIEKGR